jgi:hypothetical protein
MAVRQILLSLIAGAIASLVALVLTVVSSFAIFGSDAIMGIDSIFQLGFGVLLYVGWMAVVMFVCRVRNLAFIAVWGLSSIPLFVVVCLVFVNGRGLLPQRLGDPMPSSSGALTNGLDIVAAARSQIGVTVRYDASCQKLDYPNGDVPRDRGASSDVVVRALRDARGMDLQVLVHEDMEAHFLAYPSLTLWFKLGPDANIDHRRAQNLERFFERNGWALEVSSDPKCYLPGDIVICQVEDGLQHMMIVSDRKATDGTPLVIHNIDSGTREEEGLFMHRIVGHCRLL